MGLVVVALLPRGVARHERVLVVALDGVALEEVEQAARDGVMPHLGGHLDTGVVRSLAAAGLDGETYWETVFRGSGAGAAPRFWDALADGNALVLVHVPSIDSADYPGAVVLAGADAGRGFVGDNVGVIGSAQHLSRADLDWPYAPAAAQVAEVLAGLEPGERSEWIEVAQPGDDGRAGRFRLYRLDENAVYLTPVYRLRDSAPPGGASDASGYVADDPSWATTSSRLGEYYFRQVGELAQGRGAVAAELAARDWHLMVYFDSTLAGVVEAAAQVGGPGGKAALEAAYAALDARVAAIVDAAGPDTAVVIVGGAAGEAGRSGFFLLTPGVDREEGPVEPVERVEATLRYLAGLPKSPSRNEPIRAVRARFWRPSAPRLAAAPAASAVELPFTVEAFDKLGLLSASAPVPGPPEDAAGDSDASVATGR